MKTAVREEFKSRFDGSDKPFENVREPAGPDGKYDEEVNKELEWEEFESNLNGLKNGRTEKQARKLKDWREEERR